MNTGERTMWRRPSNRFETERPNQFYSVLTPEDEIDTLCALRGLFPDGEADDLNFCLFSTSGVHGSYRTIEDAEAILKNGNRYEDGEECDNAVTFLVIHPRTVCVRYGNVYVKTQEDVDYLKHLRDSSRAIIARL